MKIFFKIALFAFVVSFAPLANAKESEYIKKAEEYLSSIKTISADFVQTGSGYDVTGKGRIFISRPGLARWEYEMPSNVLMIINGKDLSYYDKELDQVTYAGISGTPLKTILEEDINFSEDFEIKDTKEDISYFTISLGQKKDNKEKNDFFETLSLIFEKEPFELKKLVRIDSNGTPVIINLINTEFNKELAKDLFIFKNPRAFKGRRRN